MDGACVLWTGAKTDQGYGQRRVEGKVVYVHRHAWEEAHGPIPKQMTIDHLCRVKLCINVAHLEVVTNEENARRANPPQPVCSKGHRKVVTHSKGKAAARLPTVRCC